MHSICYKESVLIINYSLSCGPRIDPPSSELSSCVIWTEKGLIRTEGCHGLHLL